MFDAAVAGFPIPSHVARVDLAIVADVPDIETVLTAINADFIVRTGAFDPWGNIALYSGVDVPKWFAKPGTVVPDYYAGRMK